MENKLPTTSNLPVREKSQIKMNKAVDENRDYSHNGYGAIKLLPNVRKFKIEISRYDIIFAMFGIKKRLAPKMKFEYHSNGSLNRYVTHQLNRMTACAKSDPVKC